MLILRLDEFLCGGVTVIEWGNLLEMPCQILFRIGNSKEKISQITSGQRGCVQKNPRSFNMARIVSLGEAEPKDAAELVAFKSCESLRQILPA